MKTLKILCVMMLAVALVSSALAVETKRLATIVSMSGTVEVKRTGGGEWLPANVGMVLNQGDIIRTKAKSEAMLRLDGHIEKANVSVMADAQLMLAELKEDTDKGGQSTLLDLAMGEVLIKAQKLQNKESRFEVKTPTSVVGVRGTVFSVKVEAVQD